MAEFILSKKKVLEQYNKIKEISDSVSYSSKTNPIITSILENETNCMFSLHAKNELKNVKDKKRIIFLAQGWNKKDIKELVELDVRKFVVDNDPDLDILLETIQEINTKIDLYIRIKLQEMSIRTEKYYVFGMDREVVNKRLSEIDKENISKLGIHFHRKTQNINEWNLIREIENLIDNFGLIDEVIIGGGIPSFYANTNDDVLDNILNRIKETKNWLNEKGIKMITEPGRFIAAPAVRLECNVINVYGNIIVVDASVYNSDMDALIVPVKLKVEGELEKRKGKEYLIKGATPCSLDLFRYRVYLNEKKRGDRIVFMNAGAYNFTSDFCDLNKIETKIKN